MVRFLRLFLLSTASPTNSLNIPIQRTVGRPISRLWKSGGPLGASSSSSSSGGGGGGGGSQGRRNLSASERARREEEIRKRERAGDVVIGKTSALPDARDYVLDPTGTEAEFLRQATKVEREVFRLTEQGLHALKMLCVEDAMDAFHKVFELRPSAYLWQAGIAKFYGDDFEGAAAIFARSAAIYESKFGEPATEERIWRHACELKLLNSMSKKERKRLKESDGLADLLAPIPEKENTAELLRSEKRKVIRITRDLFSSSVNEDYSEMILSRARLRSICGTVDSSRPMNDRKMWKLNSWYYLGLHYDALGEYVESKKCMKMALRLCPSSGNGNDIIHTLPLLHMKRRDWFDDDEFEASVEFAPNSASTITSNTDSGSPSILRPKNVRAFDATNVDPLLVESLQSSVAKLRNEDMQKALKMRGLHSSGSKNQLQQRLLQSLMEDAGLISGSFE